MPPIDAFPSAYPGEPVLDFVVFYGSNVLAGRQDAADDDRVMDWARSFGKAMSAHGSGSVYIALLAEDEADRIASALSDPARVAALKHTWDLGNVLHGNHNVMPARD